MTQCSTQLDSPFFKDARLTASFDGGQIVTDAGLLLVRQFDEEIGFSSKLARVLYDRRDPSAVRHSQLDLVRQRLYQIIAGYEDQNDATYLRQDPLFKALAGRTPQEAPLASQPTLSRLENRVGMDTVLDLVEA